MKKLMRITVKQDIAKNRTIKKNPILIKRMLLLYLFLILGINLWGQNPPDEIEFREKEAQALESQSFFHEVTCRVVYPAIGLQTVKIRYIYKSDQKNPEDDPYEMIFELVKVTVDYNIAAAEHFRIEYLFDQNEDLILYKEKETNPAEITEIFYYLKKGKGIKYIRTINVLSNPRIADPDEITERTETEHFDSQQKNEIKKILAKSKEYRKNFQSITRIEQVK